MENLKRKIVRIHEIQGQNNNKAYVKEFKELTRDKKTGLTERIFHRIVEDAKTNK